MKTLVSETGFWIFPFLKVNGAYEQLAAPRPAILERVENRTLHMVNEFHVARGTYQLYAGLGPNRFEAQQIAACGVVKVGRGEIIAVHTHLDIALPTKYVGPMDG